jgi:hypothetical protein
MKRIDRKRRCVLCDKPLSMYNRGNTCFCHAVPPPGKIVVMVRDQFDKIAGSAAKHQVRDLSKFRISEAGIRPLEDINIKADPDGCVLPGQKRPW